MDYQALEQSIVERLSPLSLTGVEVIPLPEKDADLLLPSSAGKITVAYIMSDYDPSMSTDVVGHPEKITFQIVVQSRKLRGANGIYNLLKGVKTLLLGWQTPTTEKIHFEKSGVVEHENSIWTYRLTLTTYNLAIEQPDEVSVVIATHITLVDEHYNTIEITSDMSEEIEQGSITWNGPYKKYRRSGITEGLTLTDIIPAGFLLSQFSARNDGGNPVTVNLGLTEGGNEVLGVDMPLPVGQINTATIEVQYSDDAATSLYVSFPGGIDTSVTILITMKEGIVE